MKKYSLLAALLLYSVMPGLTGCQKDKQNSQTESIDHNQSAIVNKVNIWLEGKKSAEKKSEKASIIESLKSNLIFSQLRVEELSLGEKLVVIPINNNFITINNKDKSPANYLLLIIDTSGNIRKGNIVQYLPVDKSIPLGMNTFHNIYNSKPVLPDASFTFLSITDDLLYEMSFITGKLHTTSIINEKAQSSGSGRTENECYDVYWVTFYEDGSSNWQFLYNYCDGNCQETRMVAGRTYKVSCGGGGGIETLSKQKQWDVYNSVSYGFTVISTEEFSGLRGPTSPTLPWGMKFTSLSHLSDNIINPSGATFTWTSLGSTLSISSDVTAETSISGKVTKPPSLGGGDIQIPTQTHYWNFYQVFP